MSVPDPPLGPALVAASSDDDLTLVQRSDGSVVTARLPGGYAFGWTLEELGDITLVQMVHPEDRLVARRGRSWCLSTGTPQTVHIRVRSPGGRWTWSETTYQRTDVDGSPGTEARMRDVSEMALSTEALGLVLGLRTFIDDAADAERGWREVVSRVNRFLHLDRAYLWRLSDGVPVSGVYVGDVAAPPRPFDAEEDEWLAEMFSQPAAPVTESRPSRDPRVEEHVSTLSIPVVERGAVVAVAEFESSRPIGGAGVVELARDVFDRVADALRRKQIENELDLTRQQLGFAFDAAPIGIALVGADGRFLRVNRALTELLERPEQELLELRFQDLNHPADVASDVARFDELLAGVADRYQIETRFVRPDRSVVWTLFSVAVVRGHDGEAVQFIVQFVDISAQKAREFQLAARQPGADAEDPIEALDLFLQAQIEGLPIGVINARFVWPDDGGEQAEIERGFTQLESSTRTDDYFVRIAAGNVMVVASALSADQSEAERQLAAIRSRIEAGLAAAAPRGELHVDARPVDADSVRARDLFDLAAPPSVSE